MHPFTMSLDTASESFYHQLQAVTIKQLELTYELKYAYRNFLFHCEHREGATLRGVTQWEKIPEIWAEPLKQGKDAEMKTAAVVNNLYLQASRKKKPSVTNCGESETYKSEIYKLGC